MSTVETRKAGRGKVPNKPLHHSCSVDRWFVTKAPWGESDRTPLAVLSEEDALAVARLVKKANSTVFLTHVVETHYHLTDDEP